jgi:hypothetical protein
MGMGGSQPGTSGLGHSWATYMSPKLFQLLVCFNITSVYTPKRITVNSLFICLDAHVYHGTFTTAKE